MLYRLQGYLEFHCLHDDYFNCPCHVSFVKKQEVHLSHVMQNWVFRHVLTVLLQISLRISTVLSESYAVCISIDKGLID